MKKPLVCSRGFLFYSREDEIMNILLIFVNQVTTWGGLYDLEGVMGSVIAQEVIKRPVGI